MVTIWVGVFPRRFIVQYDTESDRLPHLESMEYLLAGRNRIILGLVRQTHGLLRLQCCYRGHRPISTEMDSSNYTINGI